MELIIIIIGSLLALMTILSITMVIKTIRMRKRLKTLIVALARVESLVNEKKKDSTDNDIHKENFIKFLSDSRDWAYEYIEQVQSGLIKFVSDVDAEIAHFDEYGEVLSMSRPHYNSMNNISIAYKELKKLLPTEEN